MQQTTMTADGCLDDREDNDDDNDGFSDNVDFCPLQEGTATQGGARVALTSIQTDGLTL